MSDKKPLIIAAAAVTVAVAAYFGLIYKKHEASTIENKTVLEDFIKTTKFEPFAIPRDKWGVGSIVSFNQDGSDNIIWKNHECLRLVHHDQVQPDQPYEIDSTQLSLPQTNYAIDNNASVSMSLGKSVMPKLNLSGALTDSRVKQIQFEFESPKQDVVSDGMIERKIKTLAEQGEKCVNKIFKEHVYVIDEVLSMDSFSYAFYDEDRNQLKLDGKLIKAIGLNIDAQNNLVGNSDLSFSEKRYLGYKLFRYQIEGGLAEVKVVGKRVAPDEARRLAMGQ